MNKLRKFISLLGSVTTLIASCAPLNSMAMREEINGIEKENCYHVLTVEEYNELEDKYRKHQINDFCRNSDGFLIDMDMNYLDVNGKITDKETEKVKVDTKEIPENRVFGLYLYIANYVGLHPVLNYVEEHKNNEHYTYCISCDPNGNCVILQENLKAKETGSKFRLIVYNNVSKLVRRPGVTGICWENERVFFPKKMFEKYGLKDCGPEMFNVIKQKEERHRQNVEKQKNELEENKLKEKNNKNIKLIEEDDNAKEEVKLDINVKNREINKIENKNGQTNWETILSLVVLGIITANAVRKVYLTSENNGTNSEVYLQNVDMD